MTIPWLCPRLVPIIGAMLGLVVWSQPEKLRIWSIIVTVLSLLAVIGTSGRLTGTATEGPLFLISSHWPLVYLCWDSLCIGIIGSPGSRPCCSLDWDWASSRAITSWASSLWLCSLVSSRSSPQPAS